jgi:hypothetical protein
VELLLPLQLTVKVDDELTLDPLRILIDPKASSEESVGVLMTVWDRV